MKIPKELEKFGLIQPSTPRKRYLVVTGEGEPGTGKTDFFTRTFPGPKLVIDIDLNGDGVFEQHEEDDLLIYRFALPPDIEQDREYESFQEMKELYEVSVVKGHFRSIMVDQGEHLYEWARRGYHGTLEFGEIPESKFRVVNTNMQRFYTLAKTHRTNLFIPHRMTDERRDVVSKNTGKKSSVRTGNRRMAGWKNVLYESQCHLVFEKDPSDRTLDKFKMTVKKCTARTQVEGMEFVGEEISLANLGREIFGKNSKPGDWS